MRARIARFLAFHRQKNGKSDWPFSFFSLSGKVYDLKNSAAPCECAVRNSTEGVIMNISSATVLHFSGTGTTEKYAKAFAKALPFSTTIRDISKRKDAGSLDLSLGADELLVLAFPVYGGYVSAFIWDCLENVAGNSTPAVILAVYGARDYDNALLEAQSKLSEKGFATVGAAALMARHSIIQSIAPDRPNAADLEEAASFARAIAERLEGMGSVADAPAFEFKGEVGTGGTPGMVPQVSDDCILCGACAASCPVEAIPYDEPNTTNAETCISCLRCTDVCPMNARSLPAQLLEGIGGMLSQVADPAKKNELF